MIGNIVAGATYFEETIGDFESIATVTVGASPVADVTFSSIPSTYQHLQLRILARGNESGQTETNLFLQLNADTGSNYARHQLFGDGASAGSTALTSQTSMQLMSVPAVNATANIFGIAVIDLLDYANTNKNSTLRALGGNDRNGSGLVLLRSGVWLNTAAVNSIKIFPTGGSWVQYSHFALYGIKG